MTGPAASARTTGVAVLALAVFGILAIAVTDNRGLTARGSPDATAAPPAAGRCVDEADLTVTISCAEPHTAQIVQAWNDFEQRITGSTIGDLRRDCWKLGQADLGAVGLARADPYAGAVPTQVWAPPPLVVDTDLVQSSADAAPFPWTACVVKPRSAVTPDINAPLARVGSFRGTIETLVPLADRPINLRTCYEISERLPATVNCRAWHRGEVLAVRLVPSEEAQADRMDDLAACDRTAAAMLNTKDPTRGGTLTVTVDARPASDQINRLPADLTDQVMVRCAVEAAAGRFLTNSLLGLGDNPPPLN